MLKLKLFSNYYIFLEKVSLLANYVSFATKIFNSFKGERCMSAQGSSVKGSSQQISTSGPKVKGGGLLFSGPGPLITGGLVNNTTPVYSEVSTFFVRVQVC